MQQAWDFIEFACGYAPTLQVRSEWTTVCHPAAIRHFTVFIDDPEQRNELNAFLDLCTTGMRFMDVGAHYGLFTLAARKYGGPSAQILCVEASPPAAKILCHNIDLNHYHSSATVLNVALGPTDGQVRLLATGPVGGDFFIIPTESRSDTTVVQQRSLASVLKETGFVPTHMKLDIEGFEYEVIESGVDILRTLHPLLFLELHGTALKAREKDPERVIHWLREAGYTRFTMGNGELTTEMMAAQGYNCRMICT